MRTRLAGQLMSILSFSLHERDSDKTLDDEIKIGTVLLRLPKSQLKNIC